MDTTYRTTNTSKLPAIGTYIRIDQGCALSVTGLVDRYSLAYVGTVDHETRQDSNRSFLTKALSMFEHADRVEIEELRFVDARADIAIATGRAGE